METRIHPDARFSDALRAHVHTQHATIESLANHMGLSPGIIADWMFGRSLPDAGQLVTLKQVLHIDDLAYAQLSVLHDRSLTRRLNLLIGGGSSALTSSSHATLNQLEAGIAKTDESITRMARSLDSVSHDPQHAIATIADELDHLREHFRMVQESRNHLTARLSVPTTMHVQLVDMAALGQVDEHRAEEKKWASWMSLFVGALAGMAISVAMGAPMHNQAWVSVALLALMAVITGRAARQSRIRAQTITRDAIDEDTANGQ